MKDLRLFISDIDGTLTRSDKTISPAVIEAVHRLDAAGVPFTLISARPPSGILWIAETLGLTRPIGAFNGGTIVQPDGTVLSSELVPGDVARQVLALIDRPNVTIWLFSQGRWIAQRPDAHYDDRERKSANQEPIYDANLDSYADSVDKIVAVSDDHDMLADLEAIVDRAVGTRATVGRSQLYYLDITATRANKGDGVLALAHAFGVDPGQVAVIGDQRNDMPMFRKAGLSIAMGQGPVEVREAADHVTASNDEDGVAQAIDSILLPIAALRGK
ncbi:Cof-type HAD-IIB family hydrolase [Novosphingobium terrae]|uniref:Cof-type HAD-IIB family hydrolase n=1 Tax=Novosphingobium terrae TaxID=2726189 RepID=UPI00197CDD3B|nr:Cof-type HAD-IIB family hydrolase [Novosphingobium terrae]